MPWFVSRIIDTIAVLFIASLIIFGLMRLIPGDPAVNIAGPDATAEQIAAIRTSLGLDDPLPVQYGRWIGGVVTGDFGTSLTLHRPVSELVASRIPATLELALGGLIVTSIIGLAAGISAGLARGGRLDWFISSFNIFGISVPVFWSGLILLLVFGLWLGWFPLSGRGAPLMQDPGNAIRYLVLPSVTLGLSLGPELAWYIRNGVLTVRGEDYVRTAYSKGLFRNRITSHHILKNGLLPAMTVFGVQVGRLVSGAVVVEAVFSWPGLGRLAISSVLGRDYPTVQAVLLLLVTMFVITNMLTDIFYSVADPRVRVR